MLDPDIPFVISEYEELGSRNDPAECQYMLFYSPYDRVGPKSYPHLIVTTALMDYLVPPWEPVKWVAEIRANITDQNCLLLKSVPPHHGRSGRCKQHPETAFLYAFFLDLAGIGA